MAQNRNSLFNTSGTPFTSDYAQKSQHQKSFNAHAIGYLAETLGSWFPNTNGLTILDLCCGDGGSTQQLFNELNAAKTKVNRLVGYDISPDQIKLANQTNKNHSISFAAMDAEQLAEEKRYDLIVSFFGLHRLERLQDVVPRLHRALKLDGRIVFLVPLEKEDLYQLRCMADYTLPFSKYFTPENSIQLIEHILFWQGKRKLAPAYVATANFTGFFQPKTFLLPTEHAKQPRPIRETP